MSGVDSVGHGTSYVHPPEGKSGINRKGPPEDIGDDERPKKQFKMRVKPKKKKEKDDFYGSDGDMIPSEEHPIIDTMA